MYLFFDTETTGVPKKYNAPASDLENWPRLVQLGFILADEDGNRINHGSLIVKPEGFIIPYGAEKVHGISTEEAPRPGVRLKAVLWLFEQMVKMCDTVVAHNMAFDEKIIQAEFIRMGMESDFNEKKQVCTMRQTVDFCKLLGKKSYQTGTEKYKWPKLVELHKILFNRGFEGEHDAFCDIDATANCFFELKARGVLK